MLLRHKLYCRHSTYTCRFCLVTEKILLPGREPREHYHAKVDIISPNWATGGATHYRLGGLKFVGYGASSGELEEVSLSQPRPFDRLVYADPYGVIQDPEAIALIEHTEAYLFQL